MSRKYDNSRDVPTDTLVKRLDELSDAIAGGRDSQDREFTMRIPAECDRDADLVLAESSRRLGAADTELAAAKARIAELEKGLEPFAKLNDSLPGSDYIGSAPLDAELRLTRDDLRRAAALLKEKE